VTTVRRRRNQLVPVLHGFTAALLAAVAVVGMPRAAFAQGTCDSPPQEQEAIADTPWAQEWFDLDRLSPRPRADGVTVAVIDSGVEDGHPQLADGQVLPGSDLVEDGGPDGRVDCHGHGTAVASIIAASEADDIGFAGLAPGADILPIRVTEGDPDTSDSSRRPIPPALAAQAITSATDQDADIINLSMAFYQDYDVLAAAIEYALERDVIVVAAAGNEKSETGGQDPPAYPANYEGVVSVGAITSDGSRFAETYVGPSVDILAPGAEVVAATAGGGHLPWNLTSFAAPFVSAAAALVIADRPGLSATEVIELLYATASPGPGSATESYAGVVDPYRALTGRVADGEPVAIEPPTEPPPDPAAVARAERWERNTQRALVIVVIALALTFLGFTGAAVWRRGERHRWRPGQRRDPVFPHPIVDEPERHFYTVPTPRQRR
jgi:type VII secretion-associated serine protease mycosin